VSLIAFPSEPAAAPETVTLPEGFEGMPMVMAPKTLAEILDVTTKTLERWRVERARDGKTGPAWHKLPGSNLIRYARADVLAWFQACRVEASS
jgi:hypothetical protein